MSDPDRITNAVAGHERLPREDLLRGVAAERFELRGAHVVAGGLPLLRERDGRLEQAVRVAAWAAPGHGTVVATLRDGDTVVDRVELDARGWAGDGPSAAADGARGLLFVPAADASRTCELELTSRGGLDHRAPLTVAPQRRWEVSLVHQSHLDVGYTDPQPLVLAHHLDYLDLALDHVEATDDWAEPARFRWNVEANLPLERWLASRPRRDREALLRRVAERRIEVCALPFTMHTEAYSLDELARVVAAVQRLREAHGIEVVTAMQTDVPGATVGLLELLASADVRYLSVAHNYAGRSVPHLEGGQELARPFWWRAPSGKRLLVWHADSPHGIAYMEGNLLGFADRYETALELLPEYLLALATRPYPYDPALGSWITGIAPGTELTRTPQRHELLHLRVQSAFADNASPGLVPASVVRAWNETWAWPKLRSATNRDFFEAAEERLGDELPTYEGDWTDWWADGIGSAARELGRGRRAQAGARTAQTLHAWADLLDGAEGEGGAAGEGGAPGDRAPGDGAPPAGDPALAGWRDELTAAYEEMALFDEHTWGASNPWNDALEHVDAGALQWQWKAARAHGADERVGALLDGARARLAARVGTPSGAHAGILVVNPSGRDRTDVVELLLLLESRVPVTRALAVVDVASGERVPCALEPQRHPDYRPRGQRLRFLARDVPAHGFARYAVVPDGGAGVPDDAAGDPAVLDNGRLRAALNVREGTLDGLLDAHAGELVDGASAFGFNQYVHDRYGTADRLNHLSSRVVEGRPWMLGAREVAGDGVLLARTSNALEERATIRLRAPGARSLEVTYRLLHGGDRLDVLNVVDKTPLHAKEGLFFAFPLAAAQPAFSWDVTGGVQEAAGAFVPGSARHMRAVREWVAVADGGERALAWATREAPLVQLGTIHLPYAPFEPTVDPRDAGAATVFSWAMNNGWDTNFPAAQGGEATFAYAVAAAAAPAAGGAGQAGGGDRGRLGTGAPDVRALGAATAAGLSRPLVGVLGSPRAQDALPARGRLATVDHPHVELLAIGPDPLRGDRLVAQLHSHATAPVEATVAFPDLPAAAVGTGDFLARGRPVDAAARAGDGVRVALAPGELLTVTLDLDAGRTA
jgi:hypothetical protein